jgi:hypothetical protein
METSEKVAEGGVHRVNAIFKEKEKIVCSAAEVDGRCWQQGDGTSMQPGHCSCHYWYP